MGELLGGGTRLRIATPYGGGLKRGLGERRGLCRVGDLRIGARVFKFSVRRALCRAVLIFMCPAHIRLQNLAHKPRVIGHLSLEHLRGKDEGPCVAWVESRSHGPRSGCGWNWGMGFTDLERSRRDLAH